ncbi:hypothetical protein ABZY03_08050 [Streptomyces klenkii]|uniref:hypothetical protein n=1 Tax=Streptomyces klenkii TaxID=1420899 RepID=UPI0033AE1EF1
MGAVRCIAAHSEDPTSCEGPLDAVRITDRRGGQALACVHHGARMYASLDGARVYPVSVSSAALEVYTRALTISPFAWMAEVSGIRTPPPGEVSG